MEIDKSKLNDWAYVQSLPKCEIEFKDMPYNPNLIIEINKLLEQDEFKKIVQYIYDMGYEDGYDNGCADCED